MGGDWLNRAASPNSLASGEFSPKKQMRIRKKKKLKIQHRKKSRSGLFQARVFSNLILTSLLIKNEKGKRENYQNFVISAKSSSDIESSFAPSLYFDSIAHTLLFARRKACLRKVKATFLLLFVYCIRVAILFLLVCVL